MRKQICSILAAMCITLALFGCITIIAFGYFVTNLVTYAQIGVVMLFFIGYLFFSAKGMKP